MEKVIEMVPGVDYTYTKESEKEMGWLKRTWLKIWNPIKKIGTWIGKNKIVRAAVGIVAAGTSLAIGVIGSTIVLQVGVILWATHPIIMLPVFGILFILSMIILMAGIYGMLFGLTWGFGGDPFDLF